MIENACATQAIISIVLNRPELRIGETLENLKDFTRDFSPQVLLRSFFLSSDTRDLMIVVCWRIFQMKGLALSNSDELRKIHNSFAKITTDEICAIPETSKESSSSVQKVAFQEADSYHFIGYVPVNGYVYELDGLTTRPMTIGSYANEEDWVNVAQPAIQQRIQKFDSSLWPLVWLR